jgi:hypothetical protein
MSDAEVRMRRVFGTPGAVAANAGELRGQAAEAHAGLLTRACAEGDPALGRSLAALLAYVRGPAPAAEKRRLLCHPLFVEGLHALAGFSAGLRRWHDSVTTPPPGAGPAAPATRASLGNVDLAVLLRADRHWQGEHDFCTDALGRVGFPFSDWSLTLHTNRDDFLADQAVTLSLRRGRASWRLAGTDEPPFLLMSRDDCLGMIVENADTLERRRLGFPNPRVCPQLQCARPLGRSGIRYDPVGFENFRAHAGLTGGLIGRLLAAVRSNSPAVYRELRAYILAVRGFELPATAQGVVGSFSDPTLPGVMGINVGYTARHEPRVDPFCFTWLGHELGHTKDYLIDTVLYAEGLSLVLNPADRTDPIPRYGRPLSVRTLFQVPYVHLYEWALLMDFWEAGFRGLPWSVPAAAGAVGEDLAAEIVEAFALIRERARLTPWGEAALAHFRGLFAQALARWRSLRRCGWNE